MKMWLVLGAVAAFMATSAPVAADTMEGYVMPTACKSRKAEGGAEAHTTRCALELDCVVTGYGLWVDGEFFEFDTDGDLKALDYFRETDQEDHHLVTVVGDFSGDEARVDSIERVSR